MFSSTQVHAQKNSRLLAQRFCDLNTLQANLIPRADLGDTSVFIGANALQSILKEFEGKRLSLGKVFIEFLEYSIKGEEERILYILNSLKISSFV